MVNTSGYSLSDIAAVNGENSFGGNSWWIIIFFILLCGGGNWGYGNNRQAATTDDVQNQFNFAALERQNNETVAAVKQAAYDVTGAVKDIGYANGNLIRDVESMVQANGYELSKGFSGLQSSIDAVKYDNLLNTQNIMKNDCENTQKILDAISTNRIADMQNQINYLQLQASLAGVMRYPQATTYTAGPAPFYGAPVMS